MRIVKFFLSFIAVLFGALIGNWVGERWRALDTGEEGQVQTVSTPVFNEVVGMMLEAAAAAAVGKCKLGHIN